MVQATHLGNRQDAAIVIEALSANGPDKSFDVVPASSPSSVSMVSRNINCRNRNGLFGSHRGNSKDPRDSRAAAAK
jgi:hypothetical protein